MKSRHFSTLSHPSVHLHPHRCREHPPVAWASPQARRVPSRLSPMLTLCGEHDVTRPRWTGPSFLKIMLSLSSEFYGFVSSLKSVPLLCTHVRWPRFVDKTLTVPRKSTPFSVVPQHLHGCEHTKNHRLYTSSKSILWNVNYILIKLLYIL